MDKEFIKKWVEALRSGKYRQGRGILYDKNTKAFCCLGVACALKLNLEPYKVTNVEQLSEASGGSYNLIYDTTPLHKELGLSNFIRNALIDMNDSGLTFKEIADYIERGYSNA